MQKDVQVYCVGCGRIVTGDQAELVFKTGFYKITTPLGLCDVCAVKPAEPAGAPTAIAFERSAHAGRLPASPSLDTTVKLSSHSQVDTSTGSSVSPSRGVGRYRLSRAR
ncbi:hypothetical protein B5M42_011560 [Paenibacillus athensensis]|uniref:Uncharacterized protein n=1 Tax=Paenibacillus athensensis TaxID=1967502 RepID=A0A4Y8Q5J4_9BACL|nr:hypothetical protein [Paenibacillus athensensis]MCD1259471.1 hypothetical protein [Paenibacillus athensensis]